MITLKSRGDWSKTFNFLDKVPSRLDLRYVCDKYGKKGVQALSEATPKDTGKTADSWRYDVVYDKNKVTIKFVNDNIVDGQNVALMLQYGHGTKNGGFVSGKNYINPAIQPVFDELANSAWKEIVTL